MKFIGSTLLIIAILGGIIIAPVLLFIFGVKVAFEIAPFINWLSGRLFFIDLVLLIFALVPKVRNLAGLIIYMSSYVYGLSVWIFGLAVALTFWGWFAVIIGLFLLGIGVVPIGMLAAMFNGEWDIFRTLLFLVIITYCSRMVGYALLANSSYYTT